MAATCGEITTTKYTENQINEMAHAYKGSEEYAWGKHQTWKAIWVDKVRILHAFRRKKTTFQGDKRRAQDMIQMLDMVMSKKTATKAGGRTEKKMSVSTQTDDWWIQNLPTKQGRKVSDRAIK